jgi:hypothetical protein
MRRRFKCVYDGRDSERVTPYSFQSSSMPSASSLSDPLQAVVDTTPPVLDALEHPDIVSDTAASLIAGGAGDGDEDALLDFTGEGLPFDWQSIGRPAYSGLETPKSFGIDTIELLPAITPRDAAFFGGEQQGFGLLDAQAHPFSHGSVMNVDMSQRDAGPSSPPHDAQLVSTSAAPSDQKVLRRRLFLKECVLTSVVLGQLTGYPRMMLEGELLPPFIQAPCHYDEEQAPECRIAGRHRCLPEILAVCASLVEMFYARTPANERYVWKTIYAERARLRKNVRSPIHPPL